MNLLLDINIVLDVALRRTPWVVEAAELLSAVEEGRATAYVAAHTVATYYYIVSKQAGPNEAVQATADLLKLAQIAPLDGDDFRDALALDLRDFGDAVQAVAAVRAGADYLVTRSAADFRGTAIPVRTAGEVLALL
jgi:predicted nucleic acid-binding protein